MTVWCDLSFVLCFSDDCLQSYGNIMFDKRVVRGNTYSQNVFAVCKPVLGVPFLGVPELWDSCSSNKT